MKVDSTLNWFIGPETLPKGLPEGEINKVCKFHIKIMKFVANFEKLVLRS